MPKISKPPTMPKTNPSKPAPAKPKKPAPAPAKPAPSWGPGKGGKKPVE